MPVWNGLRLIERIGAGAFGEVYRAFDPRLQREVALKVLRPGSSVGPLDARALREARNLAKVRHPNVVAVLGAETRDGRTGFWMELVRGCTLAHVLRVLGSFSAREAALVGLDVCGALAAVHAAGLVHGDIKAQNVMREEGGRVVLMDFGTSQGRESSNQGPGRLTGTLMYLAPEMLHGGEPTIAADIYSLGVLMFHLATGDYPLRRGSLEAITRAHDEGRIRHLQDFRPGLPGEFVTAVERALSVNPARRYRTAGEMHAALSRVLETLQAASASASDVGGPAIGPSAVEATETTMSSAARARRRARQRATGGSNGASRAERGTRRRPRRRTEH
jgi:serine/threonine-protein kinase